jgi:hypothetical protein
MYRYDRYGTDRGLQPGHLGQRTAGVESGADCTSQLEWSVSFALPVYDPARRPSARGRCRAVLLDGDLYIVSGGQTRKSKNLAANPGCSIAVRLPGLDMTLDGEATRVTDGQTLERLAALYRQTGWPAEVHAAAQAFTAPYSAPSAGPPAWQLYRFVFRSAVGVASAEPYGATGWRFARELTN